MRLFAAPRHVRMHRRVANYAHHEESQGQYAEYRPAGVDVQVSSCNERHAHSIILTSLVLRSLRPACRLLPPNPPFSVSCTEPLPAGSLARSTTTCMAMGRSASRTSRSPRTWTIGWTRNREHRRHE